MPRQMLFVARGSGSRARGGVRRGACRSAGVRKSDAEAFWVSRCLFCAAQAVGVSPICDPLVGCVAAPLALQVGKALCHLRRAQQRGILLDVGAEGTLREGDEECSCVCD